MNITLASVKIAIATAGISSVAVFAAAVASAAPPIIEEFGTPEQLIDGPMVTAYTVNNLQPSSVVLPGYMPMGQLYQADVTVNANQGIATPLVAEFDARAANGQTYPVINFVAAPNGLSPAPILQGNQSSGTVYFDVNGAPPNGVVYNDGVQDILIWTSNA